MRVSIAVRTNSQSEKKQEHKVLHSERSAESYASASDLPESVDSAAAAAKSEHGVPTLTLPKKDVRQSRRVAIGHRALA